ncbi:LysR family transcriptional regulator [Pseudomonas mangiferae]|uniref:LysR family transcriptional regulator n=1 Tax=Pseudomonas mangiferae TaxID=2593654 RepID=A0A553GYN4_9PSED|nr:LysR family transcriptional regulator [Pseudomonas mangiferae]TRX74594.1 LysR family transcriptional regulator [Pseudomonas mangiferae]
MPLANGLRKIDLQDLQVFLEVFERPNLGEVADALNLSSSAVSYCLKKLRAGFADDLFLATRGGMQPTRKALAMRPHVQEMLGRAQRCLAEAGGFDPAGEARRFRLCAPEYFELLILPPLLRRLTEAGHPISLDVQRLTRDVPADALLAGELDLALGFGPHRHRIHPDLNAAALFRDGLCCVQARDRPPVTDLDGFCQRRQVFPTPWDSTRNMVDGWLQEQGRARQIAAQANSYLAALRLIPGSDLLLVLPRRIYRLLADDGTYASPAGPALPEFSLDMLWAQPFDQDPANLWLREQVLDVCAELGWH